MVYLTDEKTNEALVKMSKKDYIFKIECWIVHAIIRYNSHFESMHSRLDELFLLWSDLTKMSFVKSVEYFRLNYQDFSDREYARVWDRILTKYHHEIYPDDASEEERTA